MEIKSFVRENEQILILELTKGWGNGYVIIPKEHPLHGKGYDEIDEIINVHGGLTFSAKVSEIRRFISDDLYDELEPDSFVYGFDTAHYGDNIEKWSKEAVLLETEKLKLQFEKLVITKELS